MTTYLRASLAASTAAAVATTCLVMAAVPAQADIFTPGPVSNIVATPGDGEISVAWDPSVGEPAPTAYWVGSRQHGSGAPYVRKCTVSDPTVHTCHFYANNGQVLDIEVIAVKRLSNVNYESSPMSVQETASPVPDPPTITSRTYPTPNSVGFTWTKASNMPQPTTKTRVTASPGGAYCESVGVSCGIPDLQSGQTYTFVARSYNRVGISEASLPVTAIPYTTPSAPQAVKVRSTGLGRVEVTWLPPASNGGRPISSYRVALLGLNRDCEVGPTVRTCVFENLTAATVKASALATNVLGGDAARQSERTTVQAVTLSRRIAGSNVIVSGRTASPEQTVRIRNHAGKEFTARSNAERRWSKSIPVGQIGVRTVTASVGVYTTPWR